MSEAVTSGSLTASCRHVHTVRRKVLTQRTDWYSCYKRLAVTKSNCRNMHVLIDIVLHKATVKVILSFKYVLEAEYTAEMHYKTWCKCQMYMSV